MEHNEILKFLSQKMQRNEQDITALMDGFSAIIKEECGKMNIIAVPGVGEFIPQKIEEKIYVDEQTGKKMLTPPELKLTFKVSHVLRKKLGK